MYKKIGIIVAIPEELEMIRSIMQSSVDYLERKWNFTKGYIGEKEVILLLSGMGKVNAAMAAMEMIKEFSPDCIINSGVAGGVDPQIEVGDTVVGTCTSYHDFDLAELNHVYPGFPAEIIADDNLLDQFKIISETDSRIKLGQICTGDQFVSDPEKIKVIKGRLPQALAVDMESNSIAHVCFLTETPFISIRIISDTPWANRSAAQFQNFWKEAPLRSFNQLKELLNYI